MTFERERYRHLPTPAETDAILAADRQREIKRLMGELIAALAALYRTPPDTYLAMRGTQQ